MSMVGVIGGSGVYNLDGLSKTEWIDVASAFGKPSDQILLGELGGAKVAFLPRHGRDHIYSPSSINYRANIDVLKKIGVTDILSLSAVGSLREDYAPGSFVIIDQFIDRTFDRNKSFFETGLVGHVSMANPVCSRLGDLVQNSALSLGINIFRKGTYLVMEGPQFSSKAESELYRSWGCSVIGMTNMPEAKLAREAEICYATIAMVTDYDCWHPYMKNVDVSSVIDNLRKNFVNACLLLEKTIPNIYFDRPDTCEAGCDRALDDAIITKKNSIDNKIFTKLSNILARFPGLKS